MRRQLTAPITTISPFFYASLINSLIAEIAYDNGNGLAYNTGLTLVGDSARISTNNGAAMWNCYCPENTDLTFSCWVRRTGGTGANYSFGSAVAGNPRYKGMQYCTNGTCWLATEYCYFFFHDTNWPTPDNNWYFVTWSIIYNGGNSYTVKFYKDGHPFVTKTFTNNNWQGMSGSQFAISHNVNNSMYAYYKHFSCYPLLTDEQVADLYDNGGVPL